MKNRYIIIFPIFIIVFVFLVTYSFLNTKENNLLNNLYNDFAKNYKNKIDVLIDKKLNATLALTLALAQNNKDISDFILNNKDIDLKILSQKLRENTDFKNVWFQIIDNKGTSLYRSWIDDKNDKISEIRDDLKEFIKNPKITTSISVGRYDMTFKTMVPIFVEEKFIGMIETITHFNSIAKSLNDVGDEVDSLILAEKKFYEQLKDTSFTNKFIGEYYVANLDVKNELLDYLKIKNLDKITAKENFFVENGFLVINIFIEVKNEKLGNFIIFKKLSSIDFSEIEKFKKNVLTYLILFTILILLFFFALSYYFYSRNLKKVYDDLNENKEKLHVMNLDLQKNIEKEIAKNNEKNRILFQQNKMAAMGEMLENIAHQWRQPLSLITTEASAIKVKKEYGMLTDEEHILSLESIIDTSNYLSNTIDDFRYYFLPNKIKNTFSSKEIIDKCLKLINYDLKNNNINIVKKIDKININSFENELLQVIINILNNSKDELVKKHREEERYIFIEFRKDKNRAILQIKDSAGGIDQDIIDRVFEPYFTTKHKSKGTGLGLYMCEEIIKRHIGGDIIVRNEEYEYKQYNFKGACFEIAIPL